MQPAFRPVALHAPLKRRSALGRALAGGIAAASALTATASVTTAVVVRGLRKKADRAASRLLLPQVLQAFSPTFSANPATVADRSRLLSCAARHEPVPEAARPLRPVRPLSPRRKEERRTQPAGRRHLSAEAAEAAMPEDEEMCVAQGPTPVGADALPDKYASWSRSDFVARIRELEAAAGQAVPSEAPPRDVDTDSAARKRKRGVETPAPGYAVSTQEKEGEGEGGGASTGKAVKAKKKKEFDFSNFARRKIALRVFYYGWPYSGFTATFVREAGTPATPADATGDQEAASAGADDKSDAGAAVPGNLVLDTAADTVERRLFEALMKVKFIEQPGSCDFQRCGRTDKTVSGLGQVVSLYVRSKLPKDHPEVAVYNQERANDDLSPECTTAAVEEGMKPGGESSNHAVGKASAAADHMQEIPYVHALNCVLPDTIRVVAWAPVPPSFNARYDCQRRTYKYLFFREDLDVARMQDAADRMVGDHDFRNLCVLSPSGNVTRFVRTVFATSITLRAKGKSPARDMFEFRLESHGFLYHQIRCIMAVLFMVGQKFESPEVVDALLDVERTPCRPLYDYADGLPLVLYEAKYAVDAAKVDGLDWRIGSSNPAVTASRLHEHDGRVVLRSVKQRLSVQWQEHAIKAALFEEGLDVVEGMIDRIEAEGGGESTDEPRREPGPITGAGKYAHPDRRKHRPLLDRRTLESYESRARTLRKKTEDKQLRKAAAAAASGTLKTGSGTAAPE